MDDRWTTGGRQEDDKRTTTRGLLTEKCPFGIGLIWNIFSGVSRSLLATFKGLLTEGKPRTFDFGRFFFVLSTALKRGKAYFPSARASCFRRFDSIHQGCRVLFFATLPAQSSPWPFFSVGMGHRLSFAFPLKQPAP